MLSFKNTVCGLTYLNKCQRKLLTDNSVFSFVSYLRTTRSNHESKKEENISDYGIREEISSKAMRSYLQRAHAYNTFMKKESEEYLTGKRHLANMMGRDPETFTQEDVDEAIAYLFPSGLFVKSARPLMKPPEEVFPPKKDAEFDETGRPYHFLFYTGKPNYYESIHNLVNDLKELDSFEDVMIRKQLTPDPNLALSLMGSAWVTKEELQNKFVEELTDSEYNQFVSLMDRIAAHPYSYKVKDIIMSYRKSFMETSMNFKPPKPDIDADGRAYITTTDCPRKSARANVTVRYPGTGKISINDKDITYFIDVQSREQILFPLHFSKMLNKVDVEATVSEGGSTGQAGAIRWGISWCLRSFVDEEMLEKMRLAGLLTRDFRHRERKKPGQEGARRKFTWKKR